MNQKIMNKSINFLLENAGPVIQYRLRKEILKDLTKNEEENLLEQIYQLPHFKLVESYVKPNGYIGSGMHSWDNWKGQVLHETPLQDGEAAARLLSYYAIPKTHPIIEGYVKALRNEDILKEEFSYIPPEIPRFKNRYLGLNNGGGLMVLIYTCQALMGCGDDEEVKPFVETSYKAFESLLHINRLEDITTFNPNLKKKYNCPYIEQDVYFPCQYHLETLAHTESWRNEKSIKEIVKAINYHDKIMKDNNRMAIKIGSKYYGPLWAYVAPFKAFEANKVGDVTQRKTLTHLAMVGGNGIDVVRKSADAVKEALEKDGILRLNFESSYQKRRFKEGLKYPGPYTEMALESDYKKDTAIWCDLTFWAVQLLSIIEEKS